MQFTKCGKIQNTDSDKYSSDSLKLYNTYFIDSVSLIFLKFTLVSDENQQKEEYNDETEDDKYVEVVEDAECREDKEEEDKEEEDREDDCGRMAARL